MAPTNKNKRLRDNDQDLDTDSDNERSYNSCNNWPRFLVMESSSDDLPLSKLSPFAVQKGFQAVAGTLKNIKRLRDGSFLVECARKSQAWVFSRPLSLLIDQYVSPSTKRWTRHVVSSAAVSCSTWRRWKSGQNCRNRLWLRSTGWWWRRILKRSPPKTPCFWPSTLHTSQKRSQSPI